MIDDVALVGSNAAQNARNFIVYHADATAKVTMRPYLPAYRGTDHTYSFVVDMALLGVVAASQLHFGVMDDQYADNGGAYNIRISQLTVPEPGTLSLAACSALGLLAAAGRRRRRF